MLIFLHACSCAGLRTAASKSAAFLCGQASHQWRRAALEDRPACGSQIGHSLFRGFQKLVCRARRQTGHEWRRAVQEGMPEAAQVSLRADEAAVPELLNLAWARHEIDSDAAAQVSGSACSAPGSGAGFVRCACWCVARHPLLLWVPCSTIQAEVCLRRASVECGRA